MGVNESKKTASEKGKSTTATSGSTNGNIPSKTKQVLLLYKATDKQQLDLVDAFSRAVINAGQPRIDIKHKVNIAKVDLSSVQNVDWLNQVNNVILIQLSSDITADLKQIIENKRFADSKGILHDKILTVSFGKEIPEGWPPSGMQRGTREQKDFPFGFEEDETVLSRKDFKSDHAKKTLNSIVTALMATHKGEN